MKHEIPEFDSIEAAIAHMELVQQSDDVDKCHAQEDDTLCALLVFLARGTRYEEPVYDILQKYFLSDKRFD